MNPENVQPHNFRPVDVIYTSPDGFFSIAIGTGNGGNEYQQNGHRYGMRWNGHTDEEKGFPTSNGNPMWFQLPDDIGSIMRVLYNHSTMVTVFQDGIQRQDMHARQG